MHTHPSMAGSSRKPTPGAVGQAETHSGAARTGCDRCGRTRSENVESGFQSYLRVWRVAKHSEKIIGSVVPRDLSRMLTISP